MSYWGNRKPDFGLRCGIDWSHPLARGLVWYLPINEAAGNLLNEIAGGTSVATANRYKRQEWVPSPLGIELYPEKDDTGDVTWNGIQLPSAGFTLMCSARWTQNDSLFDFFRIGSDNSFLRVFMLVNRSTPTQGLDWSSWGADTFVAHDLTEPFQSVCTFGTNYTKRHYVNGILGNTQSAGSGYIGDNVWTVFHKTSYYTSAGVWFRELSSGEVGWLHAEPYAMILPPDLPVFYSIPSAAFQAAWAMNSNLVLS